MLLPSPSPPATRPRSRRRVGAAGGERRRRRRCVPPSRRRLPRPSRLQRMRPPPPRRGRAVAVLRLRPATAVAPAAVNDPLTFLTFVTEHPLGSTVVGTVSSFVSHGAMVDVDGMSCYLPLTGLGDPPPRRGPRGRRRGENALLRRRGPRSAPAGRGTGPSRGGEAGGDGACRSRPPLRSLEADGSVRFVASVGTSAASGGRAGPRVTDP